MRWCSITEDTYADIVGSLLREVLIPHATHATVLALSGTLGAGKTAFVRTLARSLGITEHIKSPTFIIQSRYELRNPAFQWQELVHIDAYRLTDESELLPIRFAETIAQPNTLVVIEWPEKITRAVPHHAVHVSIEIEGNKRTLSLLES